MELTFGQNLAKERKQAGISQEELAEKAHNFELVKSGRTVLCLDGQMSGIGSNSCGPELLPQYRVGAEPITLHLTLKPLTK